MADPTDRRNQTSFLRYPLDDGVWEWDLSEGYTPGYWPSAEEYDRELAKRRQTGVPDRTVHPGGTRG